MTRSIGYNSKAQKGPWFCWAGSPMSHTIIQKSIHNIRRTYSMAVTDNRSMVVVVIQRHEEEERGTGSIPATSP